MREKGFNAIITQNVSPDGIVVVNNKIIAIEIMANNASMIKQKKDRYCMFDDVIFRTFSREPIKLTELELLEKKIEKQAKKIVDDFINDIKEVDDG